MPTASIPRDDNARTSQPSPQPMSSTVDGERLSTASTIAWLVTRARLSIWLPRTAVVHGEAFRCHDSTTRSSFDRVGVTVAGSRNTEGLFSRPEMTVIALCVVQLVACNTEQATSINAR